MCNRGGKIVDRKNKNFHSWKKRKNTGLCKTNCPFRIIAQGQVICWRGYRLEEYHNHEPSNDPTTHPSSPIKNLDAKQQARALISCLLCRWIQVVIIWAQVRNNWCIELNTRDVYNFGHKIRSQELGGKTPINWLADTLKDRKFFIE